MILCRLPVFLILSVFGVRSELEGSKVEINRIPIDGKVIIKKSEGQVSLS